MLDPEQLDISDYITALRNQLSAALHEVATLSAMVQKRTRERDAALARLAELERLGPAKLGNKSEKAA